MGEVTRSSDQKKIRTGFLIFFFPPTLAQSTPLDKEERPWFYSVILVFLFSPDSFTRLYSYPLILLSSYPRFSILDSLYIRLRHTLYSNNFTFPPCHFFTFSPLFYFIHIEVTTYFYTFGHFSDTSRSTFLRELVPESQHRHLVVLSVIPPLFKSWTVKSLSLS